MATEPKKELRSAFGKRSNEMNGSNHSEENKKAINYDCFFLVPEIGIEPIHPYER